MKFLKIFLPIIFILLTIVVCNVKPGLHKTLVIKNANFKLERYTDAVENKTLGQAQRSEYGSNREVKVEPSAFLTEDINVVQNNQNDNIIEKTVETEVPSQLQYPLSEQVDTQENKNTRQLTKREEMIAWNKWRSDIQNEIMTKAEVSAPIGTMFYFSFKVDKFRHISNIKAFSTNPMFHKEVTDKLIPTIKNYEYSQLLEFPKGSVRKETKFNGMFVIWNETSLATPGDFNDVERVRVYE